MKSILSERNIVAVLFVMVLISFSLAHEDSKKMEQIYQDANSSSATTSLQPVIENKQPADLDKTIPVQAAFNQ